MNPEHEEKIEKLAKAIELVYGSPGKVFWRGFLWGLGRGVGNLIGFLLLLAVLFYLFKLTGLDDTFKQLFQSFDSVTKNFQGR
ncbi:MAG: hypothetical protein Q8R08_01500 [bacterium]|nr:hypothetical protein [bacterium]